MAQLVNAGTGTLEDVPDDQVANALTSGDYGAQKGQTFNVYLGDGTKANVDTTNLRSVLAEGGRIATGEEVAQDRAESKYGGVGGLAANALLGAASGLSGGLSDLAISKLGGRDILQDLNRAQAGARTAGEVVGFAGGVLAGGSGLLTKGVGAAASRSLGAKAISTLSAPSRLAGAAGVAAEQAVAKVAPGLLLGASKKSAGKVLANAMQKAASGAIESAIYEGGRLVSESAIEDHELTAEHVLSRIGTGALTGAAAGGLFTVGGALAGKGAGIAAKATRDTARAMAQRFEAATGVKLGEDAAEAIKNTYIKVTAKISGRNKDEVARLLSKEARGLSDNAKAAYERGHDDFTKFTGNYHDASEAVFGATTGAAKKANVAKNLVRENGEAVALDDALGASSQALLMAKSKLASFAEEFGIGKTGVGAARINKFTRSMQTAEAKIAKAESATDVYMALDGMKRDFQQSLYGRGGLANKMGRDSLENDLLPVLEDVQEAVRQNLQDVNIWGNQGKIQTEINAAWTKKLALKTNLRDSLMRVYEQSGGERTFIPDSAKIGSWLRQMGTKDGETATIMLREAIEREKAFIKVAKENFEMDADEIAKMAKLDSAIGDLEGVLNNRAKQIETLNQLNEFYAFAGLGGGAQDVVELMTEIPGGKALESLLNPVKTGHRIARIAETSAKAADATAKAIDKFITRAGSPARKAASIAATTAYTPAVIGVAALHGKKKKQEYAEHYEELRKAADPTTYSQNFSNLAKDIEADAPNITAALGTAGSRAVNFLLSKAPKPPAPDPYSPGADKKWKPSELEARKYDRYRRAVENPQSVLDDMANGRVSPESAEALRVVYPKMYGKIQEMIVERLPNMKEKMKFTDRLNLGILFGVPVDRINSPEFLSSLQAAQQSQPPQQGGKIPSATAAKSLREMEPGRALLSGADASGE